MKKKYLPLLMVLASSLTSCATLKSYPLETYHQNLTGFEDQYRVCVLSDIHLSILSDMAYECDYLKHVIYSEAILDGKDVDALSDTELEAYAPKVIILDGDVFQTIDKSVVDRFFDWIDTLGIPFAFTYGNHDYHGLYGFRYIDQKIKKCQNSLLINPVDDDVFGESNYVLNLYDGTNLKWQLFIFDSNDYYRLDYDIIHEDQVKWYENQVNWAKAQAGQVVPSIAYFHIPIEEFEEAWSLESDGTLSKHPNSTFAGYNPKSTWAMLDTGVARGYKSNDLYEKAQELKSTKAFVVGHDHTNNTDFYYNKDNNGAIRLVYTTKTGHGIYHDTRIMGCNFIYLNASATGETDPLEAFTMKRVNVSYDYQAFVMTNDYINGGMEE